jgi:hypothetical protein
MENTGSSMLGFSTIEILGVKFHLIASPVDALTSTTSIEVWIVDDSLSPFSRESGHK